MKNVLIINGHQPYSFAEGKLNAFFVEQAKAFFEAKGATVKTTETSKDYDIDEELEKHVWADFILFQFPIYWMGMPWSMKRYFDDVYTPGTDGRLCNNDGRSSKAPKVGYGSGGTRQDTKYMLSVTFNAPAEAFNAPNEYLMQGKSLDDLLYPVHLTMRFFHMVPTPTFGSFDVIKNPEIEKDLAAFKQLLENLYKDAETEQAALVE